MYDGEDVTEVIIKLSFLLLKYLYCKYFLSIQNIHICYYKFYTVIHRMKEISQREPGVLLRI